MVLVTNSKHPTPSPNMLSQYQSFLHTTKAFAYPLWIGRKRQFIESSVALGVALALAYGIQFILPAQFPMKSAASIRSIVSIFEMFPPGILFLLLYFQATKFGSPEVNVTNNHAGLLTQRTYILPVPTKQLVLVPMMLGCLAVIGPVILFALLAIVPLNLKIPVIFPMLILAITVCSSHSMSWSLSSGSSLGCLLFPIQMGAPFLCILGWINGYSPVLLISLVVFALILSISSSLSCASKARIASRSISSMQMSAKATKRQAKVQARSLNSVEAPLTNSTEAQYWFETARKLYIVLPVMTLMLGVMGFLFLLFSGSDLAKIFFHSTGSQVFGMEPLGIGDIQVAHNVRLFPLLVPATMVFALMFATNSKTVNAMGSLKPVTENVLDPFLAIRPITSLQITIARLKAATKAAGFTSVTLIGLLLLWSLLPGKDGQTSGPLLDLLVAKATLRGWCFVIIMILTLPFAIWTFLAGEPIDAIAGPLVKRFSKAGPVAVGLLAFPFAFVAIVLASQETNQWQETLRTWGIVFFGVVLVIKSLLAVIGTSRLRSKSLVAVRELRTGALAWLAALVLLSVVYDSLIQPDRTGFALTSLIIAAFLPMNRILWQVLRLDESRHR